MPRCGEDKATPAPAGPKSVFFSGTPSARGIAVDNVSDRDYAVDDWASNGDCKGGHVPGMVPNTVDTLAGWSRGRIGIVYFLANASAEQRSRIHRIILFDPGATSDIAGSLGPLHHNHGCDLGYNVNKLLADWLSSSTQNRLTVVAGIDTEMKKDLTNPSSHSTFAGMWKYYFAGIWNKSFADRALVCDYNMLSHNDALRDFAGIVKNPTDTCPSAPEGHKLQAWHP